MNILSLSTVGHSIVALAADEGHVVRANPNRRGQSEYLIPLVMEVLAEGGIAFADLNRIGVVTGPGSFTGLRVGIAAAQGLALALDCELVGITTFDLYRAALPTSGKVIVALDTLRGDAFSIGYDGDDIWLPPAVRELAALEAQQDTVLIGDLPFCNRPTDVALATAMLQLTAQADVVTQPAVPYYLREAEVSQPKSAA